jgi:hypothetical protein
MLRCTNEAHIRFRVGLFVATFAAQKITGLSPAVSLMDMPCDEDLDAEICVALQADRSHLRYALA